MSELQDVRPEDISARSKRTRHKDLGESGLVQPVTHLRKNDAKDADRDDDNDKQDSSDHVSNPSHSET